MTMDFDYLNYVTSTKLKKVNDKNVKPVSNLILKISFLTLFGCVVKITLDTGCPRKNEKKYILISEIIMILILIFLVYKSSSILSICVTTIGIIISDIMCDVEGLFTKTQKSQIILQYGKLESVTRVRRWFRKGYPEIPNHKILKVGAFWRLIQKFKNTASTDKAKSDGRPRKTLIEENVEKVKKLVESDQTLLVRQISEKTGI